MNWLEISTRLANEAEAIAGMLLPNGKRQGPEWVAGSVQGEAGDSLKVRINGNKAGIWKDFAAGNGGDLIDLWAATRGLSLKDAYEAARDYLGIVEPKFAGPKRVYSKPAKPPVTKPVGKVLAYLTEERKLSLETIQAFKVGASKSDDAIVFPFLRNDELVNVKHLMLERDANGKKKTWQAQDAEPCLLGWHLIPDDTKAVLIVEGELDAMSLYQYGLPALSINQGAGNHQWIDQDYEYLERFQEIFLWFDNDEAGKKGVAEVAARLGLERCRIVSYRLKDANEALQAGVPQEEILEAVAAAQRIEPSDLKTPESYLDDVIEMFSGQPIGHTGSPLPWPAWQERVRLRPAELSVWTGINGHGKSDLLGNVLINLIQNDERICIFSGEIKPKMLLYRLTVQACATNRAPIPFVKAASAWMTGSMWLYDHVGSVSQEKLLETFRYAAKRYRVTHFVIDSLMKCGIAEDDYKGQKQFIDALCDFKNDFNVHVHLIAHARKGESEDKAPGKLDIKGTGAISDLADNVFTVWRNKKKELEREPSQEDEDARLYCHKQRATGYEGALRLWFDKESLLFKQSADWRPRAAFQFSSVEAA
ncbi:toprim domain-containing protein [Paraburkholderia atlantica]|uniref:toprim domain-containing protein n=1 Tax=Paraburkholderia atlantica TaxID=2654982 RepID=UPI0016148E8A|nr:toprim domain-containing protein [Paraburkholderia atlantica]MBB5509587.1 twinkle protein [Paraburkholderia atlantica]